MRVAGTEYEEEDTVGVGGDECAIPDVFDSIE